MVDTVAGSPLTRLVSWLRQGYPEGVPSGDYVALFGLLARELTHEEIDAIAHRLAAEGQLQASDEQISEMIANTVLMVPAEEDVRRVAARLAAGGWPLAHL